MGVVAVEVASSKPEPMAGSTGIPPATPAPEARVAETSILEETAKGDMAEAPAVHVDVKQKAEGKSEETEGPRQESAPVTDVASPGAPAASQDCKWWFLPDPVRWLLGGPMHSASSLNSWPSSFTAGSCSTRRAKLRLR